MKEWLIFFLFFIAGLGMLISGIFYMQKERKDAESVKVYRVISMIGALLALGSIATKFLI